MCSPAKYLFFFLICWLAHRTSTAQQFHFVHYSTSDGLSNSCVYSLHQDKQGFLWVATEFGLSRFDGIQFDNYDGSDFLPENTMLSTTDGPGKDIYVSTLSKGLYKLHPNGTSEKSIDPFKGSQVTKIYTADSLLYCFARFEGKVAAYHTTTKRTVYFSPGRTGDSVITSVCLKGKSLLVTTKHNLYSFSYGFQKLLKKHIISQEISALSEDREGYTWIGGKGALYKFNSQNYQLLDSIVFDPNRQNEIDCILFDGKNNLWYSTLLPASLYCVEKKEGAYKFGNISERLHLGVTDINDLLLDKENNVWIATYNKGLYCAKNTFLYSPDQFRSLYVNSVYVDSQGKRYFGGIDGIHIVDPASGANRHIVANKNLREYTYGFNQFDHKIFIRTNGGYFKPGEIFSVYDDFYMLHYRSVLFLNDSMILSGGWENQLFILPYKKQPLSLFASASITLEKHPVGRNRVNKLVMDKNGVIWCATDAGLYVIDLKNRSATRVNNPHVLTRVTDLLVEPDNTLWIGTENALVKYDKETWEAYPEIDGHKVGKVNSLAIDNKNRLYVATYKGLFILEHGLSSYLNDKSGLLTNEINALCYDQMRDIMVLATNDGYSEIDIKAYDAFKKLPLQVVIKSLAINDSVLPLSQTYHVSPHPNDIRLHYVAINLSYPKSIIYQYQIDDNDWVETNSNSLELAALNEGEHTIKIRASIDRKNWCKPETAAIIIAPSFYNTVWFKTMIALALLLIILLVAQYRLRKIKAKANRRVVVQKQLENLKFKALNASINPHFIFNALNSIQNYINKNDKNKASNYLAKFARLIRLVLDKANEKEITIKEETERLTTYMQLEQMRFDNSFTYSINVDPDLNYLLIPNMIIQPLVENAILHGIKGVESAHISISFGLEEHFLVIHVDDNGIGINQNHKNPGRGHHSFALLNIRERLATYPESSFIIVDKSTFLNETGTLVQIKLREIKQVLGETEEEPPSDN